MNAVGLAHATSAVLAPTGFAAARKDIEQQPCLKPLKTVVWTTAETEVWQNNRSRDAGHGVFWLVGE